MPAPSPDPNPSDASELPLPTLPERRGGSAGAGRVEPAGNTSADALDASPAPGASTEVADVDGRNWYEETTLADKSSPESSTGAGSADTAVDSVSALDTVVVAAEAGAATDGGGGRLAGR